ncbi:hypothetical protein BV898_17661 [Hypsibius exemplaris]|uniref:Uncharacterized protein n=1 Tax=Hypsibius exemplaris TaxID=2072580 RepID=A0A9X6RN03_HYPEX|nr:hypothetical protein BV898_17661 [Hypsibius exemplaris]
MAALPVSSMLTLSTKPDFFCCSFVIRVTKSSIQWTVCLRSFERTSPTKVCFTSDPAEGPSETDFDMKRITASFHLERASSGPRLTKLKNGRRSTR